MKTVSFFIYGWGISCYNAFAVVYTTKEDEMKKDLVKIVTIGGGPLIRPSLSKDLFDVTTNCRSVNYGWLISKKDEKSWKSSVLSLSAW